MTNHLQRGSYRKIHDKNVRNVTETDEISTFSILFFLIIFHSAILRNHEPSAIVTNYIVEV